MLADVSVIAGYDNDFPPKMKHIDIMYHTLKYQYWIIGIADWNLYDCIDYRESYKYYLGRRIIIQAPRGTKADILLINQAIQEDCLILTNDRFLDHMDIIPSESWLKKHRVPFDIYNGEFKIYLPK